MASDYKSKWASKFARSLQQARNTSTVEEAIIQIVEEKLTKLNCKLKPPVKLDILASICGIRTIEFVAMKEDARLVRHHGDYYVQVNDRYSDNRHKGRRRFSIAHEIGHKILAVGKILESVECDNIGNINGSGQNEEERLCDFAAKNILLLTPRFITPILRHQDFSGYAVQQIKVDFEVSFEAAARALVEIAIDTVAIFYCAPIFNQLSGKEELQVVRFYKSDNLPIWPLHSRVDLEENCIWEAYYKNRPTQARETFIFNNGTRYEADVQAISRLIYVKKSLTRGIIALLSNFAEYPN